MASRWGWVEFASLCVSAECGTFCGWDELTSRRKRVGNMLLLIGVVQ